MIRPRHSNHLGERQLHDLYSNASGSNIIFPLAIGMGKIRPRQFLLFFRAGLYCDSMICRLKHFFFYFLLNLIIQPKWGLLCSSFLVFLLLLLLPSHPLCDEFFLLPLWATNPECYGQWNERLHCNIWNAFSSAWNESNLSCVWNHSLDSKK